MNRRLHFVSAAIFLVSLDGCAAKIPVSMTLPAETDLSRFRRVSILGFKGNGGEQLANALEQTLHNAKVKGVPYFTLVGRNELGAVVREQDFEQSERIDDRTRAEIGKIKGTDALVVGTVNEFGANDRSYSEQAERYNKKQKYTVTLNCIDRSARIRLDVKFIDVKTSEVAMSVPLEGGEQESDCQESGTQLRLSDKNDMLQKATAEMFTKFATQIAPHDVTVDIELREKDDAIGFFGGGSDAAKAASEEIKSGVTYATNGNWPLAIGSWERATQTNPSSAAAYYNLGVAYESQGQLDKAREMYNRAAQLRSDPLYVKATGTIETRIRNRDAVESQTRNRQN